MRAGLTLILLLLFTSGYSQSVDSLKWETTQTSKFEFHYTLQDEARAKTIKANLESGIKEVENYFGKPFKKKFTVDLFPSRASLDAKWKILWADTAFASECWMVASGGVRGLTILSPNVWKREACEHNPDNPEKIRKLVMHELIHVYHGQFSATSSLDDLESIGWFVEGVATLVSGQLDSTRLAQSKEAVQKDMIPAALEKFWTGKARYGQSGYMVEYIGQLKGRKFIFEMLRMKDEETILKRLGTDEATLINDLKKYILSKP